LDVIKLFRFQSNSGENQRRPNMIFLQLPIKGLDFLSNWNIEISENSDVLIYFLKYFFFSKIFKKLVF